jgi:hypothetical protein
MHGTVRGWLTSTAAMSWKTSWMAVVLSAGWSTIACTTTNITVTEKAGAFHRDVTVVDAGMEPQYKYFNSACLLIQQPNAATNTPSKWQPQHEGLTLAAAVALTCLTDRHACTMNVMGQHAITSRTQSYAPLKIPDGASSRLHTYTHEIDHTLSGTETSDAARAACQGIIGYQLH